MSQSQQKKNGRNGSGPPPGDDVYEGKNALFAHSGAEEEDDEEEGGELSPEELAVLTEPPAAAAPSPERAAKMTADLSERARLKSQGRLRHQGEEINIVSTGTGWRAFLAGDPRGGVGDGATPGEALADLQGKLGEV